MAEGAVTGPAGIQGNDVVVLKDGGVGAAQHVEQKAKIRGGRGGAARVVEQGAAIVAAGAIVQIEDIQGVALDRAGLLFDMGADGLVRPGGEAGAVVGEEGTAGACSGALLPLGLLDLDPLLVVIERHRQIVATDLTGGNGDAVLLPALAQLLADLAGVIAGANMAGLEGLFFFFQIATCQQCRCQQGHEQRVFHCLFPLI